jgi:hypothetical protein
MLRSSLEETFTKTRELANTLDLCTGDVLAALQAKDDARLSIVQLLCQGTELLSDMQQQQQKQVP